MIGAQAHIINIEPSPVTNGGDLEVLLNSKAAPPGKINIAPTVLATARKQRGPTRDMQGQDQHACDDGKVILRQSWKAKLDDRRKMKHSLVESET